MNRLSCLIIVYAMITSLFSIDYINGTGQPIQIDREYTFSYHNSTDDYHWYGTNQWAVLFDFDAVYPTLSLSQFSIESALIYFPMIGQTAKVELFTDSNGQPSTRMAQKELTVNQNYMQFPFDSSIQTEKIWLVLTYQTSYLGPWISASRGGGANSYYLNQNNDVPYFQSMAAAGLNCEFLFALQGEFLLSNPDLELAEFELQGSLLPSGNVTPAFTIYNHSNNTITNAEISLQITAPSGIDFTVNESIPIASPILPRSELQVLAGDPLYAQYIYTLPRDPMQMKVKATLSSELGVADTLFNNVKTKYYNVFSYPSPARLVENFVRDADISVITDYQSNFSVPNVHSINYFPISTDELSNLGSAQRYQWYALFSTPVTIVGGDDRIMGLTDTYSQDYGHALESFDNDFSFLSSGTCEFQLPAQGDNLSITINLTNSDTSLFNSPSEPNLTTSSRIFAAFFKKHQVGNDHIYVLERWIAFNDTINTPMLPGTTTRKIYTTSLSNLDLADLAANYRFYYWIQHLTSQTMLYSSFQDFQTFSSTQDDCLALPKIMIYPNPVQSGDDVHLAVSPLRGSTDMWIFNIKGQLVHHVNDVEQQTLPSTIFPSTGVYFMLFKNVQPNGRVINTTKKLCIIK